MMAQAFDMKRLHMGCGESLRRALPLLVYGKRPLSPSPQVEIERQSNDGTGNRNNQRDESRGE